MMEDRTVLSWQVGDVRITRILELDATGGTRFILPQATREVVQTIPWLAPHFADEDGRLKMSIHALVVETPSKRIIVDTCIGNDKQRDIPTWSGLQTTFLADLEAAGFAPDSIDTVLCTHLHVDHVGWNTTLVDGAWVPTFPKARYLLGRAEYEYWRGEDEGNEHPERSPFHDSVKPVWEAGLVDLVETDHQICPEVSFEPTLGHTPGHVSVRIRSKGRDALITGDFIHHPCQFTHPEWASLADYDEAASTVTRQRVFDALAGSETLVIGTHFAAPTAGHVVRDGKVYRLAVS
jgi:glyoxylase-like metal-dependent hydrolase (beta-lactamase superfamily II)